LAGLAHGFGLSIVASSSQVCGQATELLAYVFLDGHIGLAHVSAFHTSLEIVTDQLESCPTFDWWRLLYVCLQQQPADCDVDETKKD
jgi:hypothetical protein